jgi:transcriptional regulator with XRE-family HTH domain
VTTAHGTNSEREREQETSAGRLVTEARTRAGISQRELARRSGVPGPVVNAIERSRRQPSVPTLAKLLRGLNLNLRLVGVAMEPTYGRPREAPKSDVGPSSRPVVSTRVVSQAEQARAHEIYNALTLANSIKRAKQRERGDGVR